MSHGRRAKGSGNFLPTARNFSTVALCRFISRAFGLSYFVFFSTWLSQRKIGVPPKDEPWQGDPKDYPAKLEFRHGFCAL